MRLSKELILALMAQNGVTKFETTYRDKPCRIEIDSRYINITFENDGNRVVLQQDSFTMEHDKTTLMPFGLKVYTTLVGFLIVANSTIDFDLFSELKTIE
jgi:hypothetical protein